MPSENEQKQPKPFRMNPEAAPASGGHVAPDVGSGGRLFGALANPLPEVDRAPSGATDELPSVSERVRRRAPGRGEARRDDAYLGGDRYPRRRTRPAVRRVNRTVKRIDPLSVLKLSLFYYGCFLIAWLVLVAIAYFVLDAVGFFHLAQRFGRAMVLWKTLHISLMFVEKWALLLGLTLTVLGALVNAFLAYLYNVGSDLVGGVQATFVERDL
jgi:Transmembrane domain of unknown function (DUF3566)